ncbi:hypothetical protein HAX54_011967, partial [Datura stramonium]|nr:hypothetical protein [Datura stramonium]
EEIWSKSSKPHGLTWFNTQKEAKYVPENWIDEGHLALEFLTIRDKIHELEAGYIFSEPERCNLTLVREFHSNWDTSFGESTKPPYREIRHTLCDENSSAHWARDHNGPHSTVVFSYLNREAKVWVKLVCVLFLPETHMTEVTRERIVLVYMLMKGIPINFGAVINSKADSLPY